MRSPDEVRAEIERLAPCLKAELETNGKWTLFGVHVQARIEALQWVLDKAPDSPAKGKP